MYIVIGANGFLGSYVTDSLVRNTDGRIIATYHNNEEKLFSDRVEWVKIDVTDKENPDKLVDLAAAKIVEAAKRNGATVSGPIPLPTEKEIVTVLRAVHKYKDSREQFELRTYKRLIDIYSPNAKTIDSLTKIDLPAGVDVKIKL